MHQPMMKTSAFVDEPGEDEIREYAESIGIDVVTEPELMWIARSGITAPMPSVDWKPVETNNGDVYFFNFKTKESSWEHPADEKYRQMVIEERGKLQERKNAQRSLSSQNGSRKVPALARLAPISLSGSKTSTHSLSPEKTTGKGGRLIAPLGDVAKQGRPSTSHGNRGDTSSKIPEHQSTHNLAKTNLNSQATNGSKNVAADTKSNMVKSSFEPLPLGDGSRFLKSNNPVAKTNQPPINPAQILTFSSRGERFLSTELLDQDDEQDSSDSESSSDEEQDTSPLPQNIATSIGSLIVEDSSCHPIVKKSALAGTVDKADKNSSSSEKKVSFVTEEAKATEDDIRTYHSQRLNELKEELEIYRKRQDEVNAVEKGRIEVESEEKLKRMRQECDQRLEQTIREHEQKHKRDIQNAAMKQQSAMKEKYERELNDLSADYEAKLAKVRREWKEKMACEEAKLAEKFGEMKQKEEREAKERLVVDSEKKDASTSPICDRTQFSHRASSPFESVQKRDKEIMTDRYETNNTASEENVLLKSKQKEEQNNQFERMESLIQRLEQKMDDLAETVQVVASRNQADRHEEESKAAVKSGNHLKIENSMDGLESFVSNDRTQSKLDESNEDNAFNVIERAKKLLLRRGDEDVAKRITDVSINGYQDGEVLPVDFLRSNMTRLQKDVSTLSAYVAKINNADTRSIQPVILDRSFDVDAFVDEKWQRFSDDGFYPQSLNTRGSAFERANKADADDRKLADLKRWLSQFESQLFRSKFL